MFYLSTDQDGFLNGVSMESFDGCVPFDGMLPENILLGDMKYYKIVNGELIADEAKHETINYNIWKTDRIAYLEDLIADRTMLSEFVSGLLDAISGSNALNLVANLISYFASVRKDYTAYRAMIINAKKELEELKG